MKPNVNTKDVVALYRHHHPAMLTIRVTARGAVFTDGAWAVFWRVLGQPGRPTLERLAEQVCMARKRRPAK